MKRILSTILAVALTMGLIVSPVYAASPTIEVESKTANAGDTVTVNVSLENNPGISGITLKPTYNKDVLTLTKGKGNGDTSVSAATKVIIYTSDGYNIYDDGTIATLTFKVAETARSGDYDVSFAIQNCYNEDDDAVTLTPNPVVSTITVQGEEPEVKTSQVTIEDSLALSVGVKIPSWITLPKVRFTVDGFTNTVEGTTEDELEVFTFKGITPTNMSDNISIEVLDDDGEVALQKDYSIRQYCDDVYGTDGCTDKTKNLLANMLNYGAASQVYAGHNTSDLANNLSWVNTWKKNYDISASDYKPKTAYSSSDCRIKSAFLNLNEIIRIKFKVLTPDAEKSVLVFNGKSYKVSDYEQEEGAYVVVTDGLCATQYSEVYDAHLEYNGTEVHSIDYSVNSYLYNKQSSEVANLPALVSAINNYGKAAVDYARAD